MVGEEKETNVEVLEKKHILSCKKHEGVVLLNKAV
jgi:hypothetical protein